MRLLLAIFLSLLLGSFGCHQPTLSNTKTEPSQANLQKATSITENTEPFRTIARKGIVDANLHTALAKLPQPPTEPSQFWTQIANDKTYPEYQRAAAVIYLFKRHVHVGMTLDDLVRLLHHPTWLRESDLMKITMLGGEIPIQWNFQDSDFVIIVSPQRHITADVPAIYLRISGQIEEQAFKTLLLTGKGTIGTAKIQEIGYSEYTADGHLAY